MSTVSSPKVRSPVVIEVSLTRTGPSLEVRASPGEVVRFPLPSFEAPVGGAVVGNRPVGIARCSCSSNLSEKENVEKSILHPEHFVKETVSEALLAYLGYEVVFAANAMHVSGQFLLYHVIPSLGKGLWQPHWRVVVVLETASTSPQSRGVAPSVYAACLALAKSAQFFDSLEGVDRPFVFVPEASGVPDLDPLPVYHTQYGRCFSDEFDLLESFDKLMHTGAFLERMALEGLTEGDIAAARQVCGTMLKSMGSGGASEIPPHHGLVSTADSCAEGICATCVHLVALGARSKACTMELRIREPDHFHVHDSVVEQLLPALAQEREAAPNRPTNPVFVLIDPASLQVGADIDAFLTDALKSISEGETQLIAFILIEEAGEQHPGLVPVISTCTEYCGMSINVPTQNDLCRVARCLSRQNLLAIQWHMVPFKRLSTVDVAVHTWHLADGWKLQAPSSEQGAWKGSTGKPEYMVAFTAVEAPTPAALGVPPLGLVDHVPWLNQCAWVASIKQSDGGSRADSPTRGGIGEGIAISLASNTIVLEQLESGLSAAQHGFDEDGSSAHPKAASAHDRAWSTAISYVQDLVTQYAFWLSAVERTGRAAGLGGSQEAKKLACEVEGGCPGGLMGSSLGRSSVQFAEETEEAERHPADAGQDAGWSLEDPDLLQLLGEDVATAPAPSQDVVNTFLEKTLDTDDLQTIMQALDESESIDSNSRAA